MAAETPRTHRSGFGRLLVGTDLSRDGDRAVRRAAYFPLAPKARILVATVIPAGLAPAAAPAIREATHERLIEVSRRLSRALKARHRADVVVEHVTLVGVPAERLAATARKMGAELICVGRHGRGRIRRALLGSTVRRLVRVADRPVLVVVRPAAAPYKSLVIGHDLSAPAERAARIAARLAGPGARLLVVHAHGDPFHDLPVPASRPASLVADRKRRLERLAGRLPGPSRRRRVKVVFGSARAALLDAASTADAELLALGSLQRRGLRRLLVGSVAEAVLEVAPVDVLVVRRPRAVNDP